TRASVLAALEEACPHLIPFFMFRYRNVKVIYRSGDTTLEINNECGVSQGCPLSPMFFQLAISRALARGRHTLLQNGSLMSYLDDVNCISTDFSVAWIALQQA